jgi:hypothetical protein
MIITKKEKFDDISREGSVSVLCENAETYPQVLLMCYYVFMLHIGGIALHATGLVCMGVLVSICVVTQILGVPGSQFGLLNDSDLVAESESVSEDPLFRPRHPNLTSFRSPIPSETLIPSTVFQY